jgi:hypothetical protein
MAFWKTSEASDCIPFYNFVGTKDPQTGFDTDFDKIKNGHTLKCKPQGSMYIPTNLPAPTGAAGPAPKPSPIELPPPSPPSTVQGAGNFGGVVGSVPAVGVGNFGGEVGSIPTEDVGKPIGEQPSEVPAVESQPEVETTTPTLLPTIQGAGNFGGEVGSIPTEDIGKPIGEQPSEVPAVESEPAVDNTIPSPEEVVAQPAAAPSIINTGSQGAVIVGFNPGGPDGTFQTVPPTVDTTENAKSKLRRRATQEHTSTLQRRAALEKKRDFCVDRLAISHISEHSATEVCEHENSWGPDFVSVIEGLYCDMCERILWDLCKGPESMYCFDLVARELRLPDGEGLGNGIEGLGGLQKRYKHVDEWMV